MNCNAVYGDTTYNHVDVQFNKFYIFLAGACCWLTNRRARDGINLGNQSPYGGCELCFT